MKKHITNLNRGNKKNSDIDHGFMKNIISIIILTLVLALAHGCSSDDDDSGTSGGTDNGGNTDGTNNAGDGDNSLQISAFQTTVYPVLVSNCGSCHGNDGPASTPDFAHDDVATAYRIVNSNTLVNPANTQNSRLVQKPLTLHKCTEPLCTTWADEIRVAIDSWVTAVAGTETGSGITGASILSSSLTIADGTQDEGAGRVEDAIIAKYEFKSGTGQTALDTSGVSPALNLTLSADVKWVAGQGIELTDPNAAEITKAIGTPADSKKLYDMIAGPAGSKAYSIEAWTINASTALDGPARIVSYSSDSQNRNFTMGQITSYYNFRNRSDVTGLNGSAPALESDNNAGDLKTELQHVVFTFDETNGRNIYVNGIKTTYQGVDADPAIPANISNWDDTYTFVLGNEAPDNVPRQWLGKLLFVGIHNRALTADEILQNTLTGVGERYILDFDISSLLDTSGATTSTITLIVSELDQFSYVFGTPVLTTDIAVPAIPVNDIRIAVNGNIPGAAQSFRNVDLVVTQSNTELSSLGAVIPKDLGPDTDVFSLVFSVLGNNSNIVVEQNPQPVTDSSVNDPSPDYGFRTHEQINNTMSALTGVDKGNTANTFNDIQQQLPGTSSLGSFVSANQIGIAKLALEYCDALVEDNTLRTSFFGNGFEFNSAVSVAFSDQTKRDIIISNLVSKMVGTNLDSQPNLAEIQPDLDQLITELSTGCNVASDCDNARTRTIVKATCAAVLGSAAVLID